MLIPKTLKLLAIICLLAISVSAQNKTLGGIVMNAQVVNGDTIPVKYLPYLNVVGERTFKSKSEKQRWSRLRYNVQKVYPMARLAAQLLEKYSGKIEGVETDKERRKYFKMIEQELKAEYMDDLEKMNTTQGRILIKLIDRETGSTSYQIVQEFRGNLSAFFWQSLSRLFGQDLKSRYDPDGEDKEIEYIVQMIEAGVI